MVSFLVVPVGHSMLGQVVTNLQCILFCYCDSVVTEIVPEFVHPIAYSYVSFLMLISVSNILYSYRIECFDFLLLGVLPDMHV